MLPENSVSYVTITIWGHYSQRKHSRLGLWEKNITIEVNFVKLDIRWSDPLSLCHSKLRLHWIIVHLWFYFWFIPWMWFHLSLDKRNIESINSWCVICLCFVVYEWPYLLVVLQLLLHFRMKSFSGIKDRVAYDDRCLWNKTLAALAVIH